MIKISQIYKNPAIGIKSDAIGWRRSDGIINFATKDSAKTYAFNRCISDLKKPEPFEHAVIVKDNMILKEADGERYKVMLGKVLRTIKKYKDYDIYHGHPAPLPLSFEDYLSMFASNNTKSCTAVNKNFNFSKMTKLEKPRKKFLPDIISKYIFLIQRLHNISKKYDAIENKYYKEVVNICNEMLQNKEDESSKKLMNTRLKALHKIAADNLNRFWKDNSEYLRIKYEYGNLIKMQQK